MTFTDIRSYFCFFDLLNLELPFVIWREKLSVILLPAALKSTSGAQRKFACNFSRQITKCSSMFQSFNDFFLCNNCILAQFITSRTSSVCKIVRPLTVVLLSFIRNTSRSTSSDFSEAVSCWAASKNPLKTIPFETLKLRILQS